MKNINETIPKVPLTSIAVDLAGNARSGAWKRDSGFEAESAFEELKESIPRLRREGSREASARD